MDNEQLLKELETLKEENQQLRKALGKKSSDEATVKRKTLAQIVWRSFVTGKKLDVSLNEIINEYNSGFIKQTTAVSVITAAFRRMYRVSIPFLILAILPSLFVLIQTFLLRKQNDLITKQNERIDSQIQLSEAERRSGLVFLLGNVMDAVADEMRVNANNNNLSPTLVGQIIAVSRGFKPYRYMEGNKLIEEPLSPERGQLLISLLESNLSRRTYNDIFKKAEFTFADLAGATLSDAYLIKVILNKADLSGTSLGKSNFSGATLHDVNFTNAVFYGTNLRASDLQRANFTNATFREADLSGADLSGAILTNANLEGAKVDVQNWFEQLEKLNPKPIGLEEIKQTYKVGTTQIRDYYIIEKR